MNPFLSLIIIALFQSNCKEILNSRVTYQEKRNIVVERHFLTTKTPSTTNSLFSYSKSFLEFRYLLPILNKTLLD